MHDWVCSTVIISRRSARSVWKAQDTRGEQKLDHKRTNGVSRLQYASGFLRNLNNSCPEGVKNDQQRANKKHCPLLRRIYSTTFIPANSQFDISQPQISIVPPCIVWIYLAPSCFYQNPWFYDIYIPIYFFIISLLLHTTAMNASSIALGATKWMYSLYFACHAECVIISTTIWFNNADSASMFKSNCLDCFRLARGILSKVLSKEETWIFKSRRLNES